MKKVLTACMLLFCVLAFGFSAQAETGTYVHTLGTGSITIERGTGMIVGAEGLTGDVVIPSSAGGITITGIKITDEGFFYIYSPLMHCTEVTSITFPGTIKTIPYYLMPYAKNLTSVRFEEGVESIEGLSFTGCKEGVVFHLPASLTGIQAGFTDSMSKVLKLAGGSGTYSLDEQGLLLSKDGKKLIDAGTGERTDIVIPAAVESVSDNAFKDMKNIRHVDLMNVTAIGENAFQNCTSLETAPLKEGLATIGYGAFSGCSNLKEAFLPESAVNLGDWIFAGCESLRNVTLPKNLKALPDGMFSGCSKLTELVLGDNVTEIGSSAFSNCSGLKNVMIPQRITKMGDSVFSNCKSLQSVTIPDTVQEISHSTFFQCESLTQVSLPSWLTEIPSYMFTGTAISSFEIRPEITRIGEYAFSNTKLTTIKIPNTVTEIGLQAFADCKNLTEVTIPEKITKIEDDTFRNNSALTRIQLPSALKEICNNAFYGCSSLTEINLPSTLTSIHDDAFYGCSSLTEINLPPSLTFIYFSAFNATGLTEVTVNGDGVSCPSFSYCKDLTEITLSDGVINLIPDFSTLPSLKKMVVSDTVVDISPYSRDVPKDLVVYGKTGSGAHLWANANKLTFVSTGETRYLAYTDSDMWAKDSILWASQKGLFLGTTVNTFSPDTNITRAMFITVLHRYAGEPAPTSTAQFSDVKDFMYYAKAALWGRENDVIDGTGGNNFSPNAMITREQLVTILYRYAKSTGTVTPKTADFSGFTDAGQISDWAEEAMSWALANDLIQGRTPTTLKPRGTATRAEAATIMQRFDALTRD